MYPEPLFQVSNTITIRPNSVFNWVQGQMTSVSILAQPISTINWYSGVLMSSLIIGQQNSLIATVSNQKTMSNSAIIVNGVMTHSMNDLYLVSLLRPDTKYNNQCINPEIHQQ